MQKIHTPGIKTIEALAAFLGDTATARSHHIKTMLVKGDNGVAALLLQGGHTLNLVKAAAQPAIGTNATLLPPAEAKALTGADFGSLGPVNLPLPVIADYGVQHCADMVCGANEDDYHYTGVNFGRDCPEPPFADLRNATAGDPAPSGGIFSTCRGIEVGHIFQLGDKYSRAMSALTKQQEGAASPIMMGCYGIGVTRIAAAAIEQNHDERGIIFPTAIAPFTAALAPIGWKNNPSVRSAAEALYKNLRAANIDTLLDDRDLRPGAMFAELDLLGIPHRLVIGERGLATGEVEYKYRAADKPKQIPLAEVVNWLQQKTISSV